MVRSKVRKVQITSTNPVYPLLLLKPERGIQTRVNYDPVFQPYGYNVQTYCYKVRDFKNTLGWVGGHHEISRIL